jgi:hypothetical protein
MSPRSLSRYSYTAYFFYGVGLLSGNTMDECKEEVKHKFIPTYALPAPPHALVT